MTDCDLLEAVAEAEEHVIRWRYKTPTTEPDARHCASDILMRWLSICYGIEIKSSYVIIRAADGLASGYDHCWKITRVHDPEKAIMFKLRF
jgi:hypothetical protein